MQADGPPCSVCGQEAIVMQIGVTGRSATDPNTYSVSHAPPLHRAYCAQHEAPLDGLVVRVKG